MHGGKIHEKFQFHKVRLKAHPKAVEIVLGLFQFHKVRLKGVFAQSTQYAQTFQFHKVRLKEREELDLLCL